MTSLLEEHDLNRTPVDDRERLLREAERDHKANQEQLRLDQ